jgi:hypothetical protein
LHLTKWKATVVTLQKWGKNEIIRWLVGFRIRMLVLGTLLLPSAKASDFESQLVSKFLTIANKNIANL